MPINYDLFKNLVASNLTLAYELRLLRIKPTVNEEEQAAEVFKTYESFISRLGPKFPAA